MTEWRELIPWDRLDDVTLFGMVLFLIIYVGWMGHWDLVNSLSSAFTGAVFLYIKGGETK